MSNNSNKSIKNWDTDDKPREKLLDKGATALTNAELLAIIIQNGTLQKSALNLGKEILEKADNKLEALGKLSIKELQQVKGIGTAKAISIVAALEIGKRIQKALPDKKKKIKNSQDAAEICIPTLRDKPHEAMLILFLNNANQVIHTQIMSEGGLTGTIVDIRMIFKAAILHLATGIIMAHNHPSGNLAASKSDIDITQKINTAGSHLDIKLLDHLIIGNNTYLSMQDQGLI